jgi:hypothetical protein
MATDGTDIREQVEELRRKLEAHKNCAGADCYVALDSQHAMELFDAHLIVCNSLDVFGRPLLAVLLRAWDEREELQTAWREYHRPDGTWGMFDRYSDALRRILGGEES